MSTAYEIWKAKQNNQKNQKTAYEQWKEKQLNLDADLQKELSAARNKDVSVMPTGNAAQLQKRRQMEQMRNIAAVSAKPVSAIALPKNKPLYPNATIGQAKINKPAEIKKNIGAFIGQFGEGAGIGNVARAITKKVTAPVEQQLQQELPSALPRYNQPDTRFENVNPAVETAGKFTGQLTKELGYAAAGQGLTGAALSKMPWLVEAIQKTPNIAQAVMKGAITGANITGLKQITEPKESKPGLKGLVTSAALWGGGALGGELASKAIESLTPQLSKIPGLVDVVMKPNGAQTMQVKPAVEALVRGASNNLTGTIAALPTVSDKEKKQFIKEFGPNLLAQGIMDTVSGLGAKGNIKISDLEKAGLTKKQLPFLKKVEVPTTKPIVQDVMQAPKESIEAIKSMTTDANRLQGINGVADIKKAVRRVPAVSDQIKSSFLYQPEVRSINKKTWYHGTNTKNLTAEKLDPFTGSHESLLGHGIYLTDNPEIAEKYANTRSKKSGEPVVYQAKTNINKVLDFEKPLPDDAIKSIRNGSYEQFQPVIDEIAKDKNITGTELFKKLKDAVSEESNIEMIPTSEYVEMFQNINSELRKSGYDAITHTGGKVIGGKKHQVLIPLDPNDSYSQVGRKGEITEFKPYEKTSKVEALAESQPGNFMPKSKIKKNEIPIDDRNYEDVSKRNVKSYQYDHPEIADHIQAEAIRLIGETNDPTFFKGQKIVSKDSKEGTAYRNFGITKNVNKSFQRIQNATKATYSEINKALEDIANNYGSENYALAKKIELIIDDNLTKGTTDIRGNQIEPNTDYITKKKQIEGDKNGLQGQEGQGQAGVSRPSSQELGIVFKPKLPFQQVEPRRKTMTINATEEKSPTINKIVTSKKGRMPMKTIFDNLYQKFVNNQHYITLAQKAAGKTVANKDMAIMASNSRNAPGISGYILKDALVTKEGKEIGKPFKSIIDEVSKQHEQEFNDYILHRHNIGRMAQKKPVFSKEVTPEISEQQIAKYEAKFPDFKRIADQYDSFNKNFMQEWAIKTGLVSKETMDHLNKIYPHYAPTYRQMEPTAQTQIRPGKGFVNQPNVLKKATGSERPIFNPLEKTLELVDKTVKAAKYNEVGQTIVEAIRKDPEKMREWGEIVKDPRADLASGSEKALENGDIGEAVDNFVSQYDKPKLSGKNIVRVMENGKSVYLKINKPEFLESITGLTNYKPGEAEKIFRMITTPYKALITGKNPIFAAKNIARDIPTAYINGSVHNPFKFVQNLSEAAKDMAANSESFREYKALGGGQSGFFLEGNGKKSNLKKLYKGEGVVSQFNESIESLPRYAEYKATVERGGGNYTSKMQGIFNANELTVNFARHGNITKSIDAFVPYLNPSVQGLDKLVRQFQKNPLATIGKGVLIVTIPQIALNLINNSNPNYQQLDNRTKDTYFLIPNYVDKGKTFIKIPKSREYGVIFADTFDRIQRGLRGDQHAFDGYLGTVETNFAPTNIFENNIASPATFNLKSNKDFAGRTIVPQGMQSRSPKYQWDENTSEISKAIGQKLNVSPKQADYLIKSYTGVIGTFALPVTTKSNKGTMQQILGNTISRNFVADPVFSNNIVNNFYEQKKKAETIKADANFNNKELPVAEDNKRHQYNIAAQEISKVYDQIRAAKTEEEKRELRKQINEIAKIATKAPVNNEVKETKNDVLEKLGIEPESKQKFY